MSVTVVITTWKVPLNQQVLEIKVFRHDADALAFINAASKAWWEKHEGDRWIAETKAKGEKPTTWGGLGDEVERYEPIKELGHDDARYEIWDGENGFHAMLDQAAYARLHEAYYKKRYDDKGEERPGYLINTYLAGNKPGGMSETEREHYTIVRDEALENIQKYAEEKAKKSN